MLSETVVNDFLKPLLLKDLRIQCRARGLNPGGNREALFERVKEHMLATGDMTLVSEAGDVLPSAHGTAPTSAQAEEGTIGIRNNNYGRPEGQNVGNFITDRPSSRVLAPPGGGTHFSFGGEDADSDLIRAKPSATAARPTGSWEPSASPTKAQQQQQVFGNSSHGGGNNYARPSGQNVGNFITDKPSSRVLAPPGGSTSITFG